MAWYYSRPISITIWSIVSNHNCCWDKVLIKTTIVYYYSYSLLLQMTYSSSLSLISSMSVKNDKPMLYSLEITEIYPYSRVSRVRKNWKFTLFKNISSNHIISKNVAFTIFLSKERETKYQSISQKFFQQNFFSWKQLLFQ